jgi:hypothetical protein
MDHATDTEMSNGVIDRLIQPKPASAARTAVRVIPTAHFPFRSGRSAVATDSSTDCDAHSSRSLTADAPDDLATRCRGRKQ